MMDFLWIAERVDKRGVTEIYPEFIVRKSSDLMIRGGDFYAVWDQEKGMWSTDEDDLNRLVDAELDAYAEKHKARFENGVRVLHMIRGSNGMIDVWHKYCQRQMRDNYHSLDENLIFSNTVTTKEDYSSRRLSYPLEEGEPEAYDRLMSVLYSPEERHKIEWAIGSVITGESKKLQKFLVLYGESGTGKSTVLNIIQLLFEGYYSMVDAKALGNGSNQFAMESFRKNPLVAIEHDSDLSRIEDNTRLNSLVSHEEMTVNEKHKTNYTMAFKCFLFLGTNKPVKITDAKSGIMRRLIDVTPSGQKIGVREYRDIMKRIPFELGKIANRCKKIFEEDPLFYDNYTPVNMISETNDFFNFVSDSYYIFKRDDGVSLQAAWDMYKTWCEDAKVMYPLSRKAFKVELKNYFKNFSSERVRIEGGERVRNYFSGFRADKFESTWEKPKEPEPVESWIIFDKTESLFDVQCADCPAQYASEDEKPLQSWDKVTSKLSGLDTHLVHYVRLPENHIVIDFDIPDEDGKKSPEANLKAASLWPKTYAERSKSGAGIHLHYIYTGDPAELSRVYGDHIEIKVFTGKSSLRRKLSFCNDIPIAQISSGLPLREKKKMTDKATIKSEAKLVELIQRNLRKEIHHATKPSVDFIYKILEDAYESGLHYDVSNLYSDIYSFAAGSTNQSEACLNLVRKMKFQSKDVSEQKESKDDILTFFDIEVAPNHFLVCWMYDRDDASVVAMLDPSAEDIYNLIEKRLVGFNNRKYDNHILYGRMMGKTAPELFQLSCDIIQKKTGFYREAYNLSYTDIFDFSTEKKGLKKFEIDLGIPHKEFPFPWDQPIPDDKLDVWIDYCKNDVIATRAVFHARKEDFVAREILAVLAKSKVNDTTNQLTTKIIFGSNQSPKDELNYRFMGDISDDDIFPYPDDVFTRLNNKNQPVFPGYRFSQYGIDIPETADLKVKPKSWYRGENPKEGGYVYAEPGIHCNVALLDIASMHPSSIIAENLFGDRYTARFKDIVDARIFIKHKDFDSARKMLNGALAGYLTDEGAADNLASALKIPINSVYGLTSAKFDNAFRDPRNIDNIVAKRGALFMINLKHAVQARGFTVAHIKTDSIKIPDATPEIIDFVMNYGKLYGYNFEHEATYEKMCLVNDAVYVAKYASEEFCQNTYGYLPSKQKPGKWTATGEQFKVPYTFKKLFSHEDVVFKDLCEVREVKDPAALYLVDGDNYIFVGKVGQFCPIKEGCGGRNLMRGVRNEETGELKFSAADDTKGYLWLESDTVKNLGKQNDINLEYYDRLVNKAADDISQYGDLEWFLS